jgi:hypothetical protein
MDQDIPPENDLKFNESVLVDNKITNHPKANHNYADSLSTINQLKTPESARILFNSTNALDNN